MPQRLLAYLNFSFLFFCMTEALLDLGNAADFHGFGVDSTYRDDQCGWPYIGSVNQYRKPGHGITQPMAHLFLPSLCRAILWVVLWPFLLHQMQEVRRKEMKLCLL